MQPEKGYFGLPAVKKPVRPLPQSASIALAIAQAKHDAALAR